ncbi:MAG: ShlB/FhaC/HecB family hemolysin secretion/activation protein [Polaromonas sp.]|nr:ShlB/FhaC/HecB family hemolysin secretion/activation protein [Polaromonas sp.]
MSNAQRARGAFCALTSIFLLITSGALAQTVPDPISTLRRDTDQAERALRPRAIDLPEAPAAKAEAAAPDGVQFTLRSIVFSPSEILSEQALTALAQPLIGQSVSMTQLRSLVAQVNALYLQKGVSTAEALLPPQELQDGEVRVLLVEGKLGNVELKGQTSLSSAYVLDRLKVPVGQLADTSVLSRSVRRFNATNDAQVNLTLRPGSEFGRTDVLVDLQEQPRHQFRLLADNFGNPATGAQQVTGSFRRLSSVIEGDRLDVYAINTQAILTGRVAYDIPVGNDGLRVGVSEAHNRISYILAGTQGLTYAADARTESLDVAYPLLLTDRQLIRLLGSLNQSHASALTGGEPSSATRVVHENIALQGDVEANGWRASWSLGQTWLQWQNKLAVNGSVPPLRESYTDASVTALASVTANAYLRLNVSARVAPSGLPASERYLLGGVSTLRGYAAGSLNGTGGSTTSLELHREWQISSESSQSTQVLDGFVFVDQGRVTDPGARAWSTGLGVNWTLPGGLRLQAFAAHVGTPALAKGVSSLGLQLSFNHNL